MELLNEFLDDKHHLLANGDVLKTAASTMVEIVNFCRLPAMYFDLATTQSFFDVAFRHFQACDALDLRCRPKHHAVAHMVERSCTFASPSCCANWTEEGLNRLVKAGAMVAHRSRFYSRVLCDYMDEHT